MAVINSGAFNDGGGDRYFQFYYTTSKYSAGVTRIDWTFKSCYNGSTSGRSVYCNCTLSASMGKGTLYPGYSLPSYSQTDWTYTSFNNGASYPGGASHYVNKSGTFYVNHDTSGNASINIYIDANIYYTAGNQDGSGTISLTGNPPYTNVTKPTSVTVNASIAKPGDTITVSWSGASAGTNNAIKNYRVIGSYNAYPSSGATWQYDTTTTSTSATFTLPNSSYRGTTVQFEVQVIGTHNTTTLAESPGAACTVNSLPDAPSVSVDKSVIPSKGGTVNFTVTAGADSQSSQTKTLYYSTSATGTKTAFTSPLSQSLTDVATYYFWTYDGLEYSSTYTSKSISKNTKPTVSIDSTNNISSKYNNISYISNLKLNGSSNKEVSYKWTLNNNDIITQIGITQNIDIKPWEYGVKPGDSYYLKLEVDDGIETSSLTTIRYNIPATVSVLNNYNQLANNNIANTNGDFYDNIRALLPIDTYHENAKTINLITNYGVVNYNKTMGYCDISSLSNLEKEKEYNFNITINADGLERTYTFKKKKTSSFDGGVINGLSSISVFKPNNIMFNIKSPDGFVNNQNYNFYNYNLGNSTTSNNYSAFKIKFKYNNKESQQIMSNNSGANFKIDSSTTNDTIYFSLSSKVWNTVINDLGIIDSLNNINVQTVLEITNLFGATSSYTSNLTLNMKGDISLSDFIAKIGTTTLSTSSTSIREGQTITWNYNFNTYNKQKITSEIYIYRSDSKETPSSSVEWLLYSTATQEINGARNSENLISQAITQSFKVKEINESKYIFFKVKVIDYFGQIIESEICSAGISNRHIPAKITITESKYNKENKKISIKYKIDDNGGKLISGVNNLNTSLSNSISVVKTNNSELGTLGTITPAIFNPTAAEQTITISIADFDSPVLNLNLIIKTRLNLDGSSNSFDKITSIPFIIYNANPTVALRSNYLGINTKDFSIENSEGVVIIAPSSNRDKVIFQGLSGNVVIDIEKQTITGITIDGGTW